MSLSLLSSYVNLRLVTARLTTFTTFLYLSFLRLNYAPNSMILRVNIVPEILSKCSSHHNQLVYSSGTSNISSITSIVTDAYLTTLATAQFMLLNDQWCEKTRQRPDFRYYRTICLEWLRKIGKRLCKGRRFSVEIRHLGLQNRRHAWHTLYQHPLIDRAPWLP